MYVEEILRNFQQARYIPKAIYSKNNIQILEQNQRSLELLFNEYYLKMVNLSLFYIVVYIKKKGKRRFIGVYKAE